MIRIMIPHGKSVWNASDEEDSVEDVVPDFAYKRSPMINVLNRRLKDGKGRTGNTKPELEVFVVVREVVLLHLAHVRR